MREHTCIPDPEVYAYDSSSHNSLGYEWILMDRIRGEQYAVVEDDMSCEARIAVAETLADWVDSLSRLPFTQIGSLYCSPPRSLARADNGNDDAASSRQPPSRQSPVSIGGDLHLTSTPYQIKGSLGRYALNGGDGRKPADRARQVVLGPLVIQPFFGDWRVEYDFDRGPFATLHDFALGCAAANKAEVLDARQEQRAHIAHLRWLLMKDDLEATIRDATSSSTTTPTPRIRRAREQLGRESEAERRDRHDRAHKHRAELQSLMALACTPGRSPVSFEDARYDFTCLPRHRASTATLDAIIDAIRPRSSQPCGTTVLVHWDMSKENVLVDAATGRPTALLDWEQAIAVPLSVASYYPPLLLDDDGVEHEDEDGECEDDSDSGSDSDDQEDDQEDDHESCSGSSSPNIEQMMCRAFNRRLRKLSSPWLEARRDRDESQEGDPEHGDVNDTDDDKGLAIAGARVERSTGGQAQQEEDEDQEQVYIGDDQEGPGTSTTTLDGNTCSPAAGGGFGPPSCCCPSSVPAAAAARMPSQRLLNLVIGELQHSFYSPGNLEYILQDVKDEIGRDAEDDCS